MGSGLMSSSPAGSSAVWYQKTSTLEGWVLYWCMYCSKHHCSSSSYSVLIWIVPRSFARTLLFVVIDCLYSLVSQVGSAVPPRTAAALSSVVDLVTLADHEMDKNP